MWRLPEAKRSVRSGSALSARVRAHRPRRGPGARDGRAPRRADRRRRPVRHRRRCHLQRPLPGEGPTRSSRRATRSAAPGTCSATRASARTRTCTRSATRSARGPDAEGDRRRPVDPAVHRARPRASTASTGRSASATASSRADWSRADARWTRRGRARGTARPCALHAAASSAAAPATTATTRATRPSFPGEPSASAARVVHPQHWPEDLDYAGKRVVVIGSGATAVTLVPAMARERRARDDAAALADLRRLAARARPDRRLAAPLAAGAAGLRARALEERAAGTCCSSSSAARRPAASTKRLIAHGARGSWPAGYDVDTHFKPRYNPWDQRLCLVPDGDLFQAIRARHARRSSPTGSRPSPRPASGSRRAQELEADIVVTATGLEPAMSLGGIELAVDGARGRRRRDDDLQGHDAQRRAEPRLRVGYTNASWTLKADLTCALRVPAAQPHGRATATRVRGAARPGRQRGAVPRLHLGLRAARASTAAQAGPRRRGSCTRTTAPTSSCCARRDRRRRAVVPGGPGPHLVLRKTCYLAALFAAGFLAGAFLAASFVTTAFLVAGLRAAGALAFAPAAFFNAVASFSIAFWRALALRSALA